MSKHKAWRKPKEKCQPQLSASNFECVDCGQDTSLAASREYYMVKLPIWLQAGMIYEGGMLCIWCLESRIGRQLTTSDFDMDLPINTLQKGPFSVRSERLKNRIKL